MFPALLPRVLGTARVAFAPRAFVVTPRTVPFASRHSILFSRSFAAAATATKRTTTAAGSTPTGTGGKAKPAGTRTTKAAPKKAPKKVSKKEPKKATKKPARKLAAKPPTKRGRPTPKKAKKAVKPKEVLPKPPTKPPTVFALYVAAQFSSHVQPGSTNTIESVRGVIATISKEWNALPAGEKQKYSDDAAQRMKEYRVKFAEWGRDISPVTLRKINKQRALKKKTRIRLAGHADMVKPTNPYLVFVGDQRELPESWDGAPEGGMGRQQWFIRNVGSKWKALSAAEKDIYKERSSKHNIAYQAQKNA